MAEVCDTVQEPVTKTTPKGKMQEGKVVVLRGLQIAVEKKEVESKGERERHTHMNAGLPYECRATENNKER